MVDSSGGPRTRLLAPDQQRDGTFTWQNSWICDWRPSSGRPSYAMWRELARFGFPLVRGMVGDRTQKAVQSVVTGRMLGARDLGLQRYGERIARIRVNECTGHVESERLVPGRRLVRDAVRHDWHQFACGDDRLRHRPRAVIDEDRVAAVLSETAVTSLSVPPTLHSSLIARLDRMGPAAREIAQIGAVLGREFGYDLIERVARRPERSMLSTDRLTTVSTYGFM